MKHTDLIKNLAGNKEVFAAILQGKTEDEYTFKPTPDKWCMQEVLCHLVDEEKEDFRTRVEYVLRNPAEKLPTFNPVEWPKSRNYMGQDYELKRSELLAERSKSIAWLESLNNPPWHNTYQHPTLGPMSAELFLANWLAHDYIHIRQLNRLAFEYLQHQSGIALSYAGNF
jgi:DinB superfamily